MIQNNAMQESLVFIKINLLTKRITAVMTALGMTELLTYTF